MKGGSARGGNDPLPLIVRIHRRGKQARPIVGSATFPTFPVTVTPIPSCSYSPYLLLPLSTCLCSLRRARCTTSIWVVSLPLRRSNLLTSAIIDFQLFIYLLIYLFDYFICRWRSTRAENGRKGKCFLGMF